MKPNKYKAIKVEIDGILFDSKAEGFRYSQLKLLEKAGEIFDLTLQPPFELLIDGEKIFTYRADFSYRLGEDEIIEDVKGMTTPVFNLKKRIIEATYLVEIRMVDKYGNRKLTKTGRIKK